MAVKDASSCQSLLRCQSVYVVPVGVTAAASTISYSIRTSVPLPIQQNSNPPHSLSYQPLKPQTSKNQNRTRIHLPTTTAQHARHSLPPQPSSQRHRRASLNVQHRHRQSRQPRSRPLRPHSQRQQRPEQPPSRAMRMGQCLPAEVPAMREVVQLAQELGLVRGSLHAVKREITVLRSADLSSRM